MPSCKVELLGSLGGITDLSNIEVDLDQGTGLGDLIAKLRQEAPSLEGPVFVPGENRLTRHYVFNINGRFYMNDSKIQIQSSDRILLLPFPIGG